MIPAFVAGILIGIIVGWAISAWCHALTIASPETPSAGISAIGVDWNGNGGAYIDVAHARLLKPILEKLGREVRL
jgi:hypothetical protein